MEINNLSKTDREVVLKLTSEELEKLSVALKHMPVDEKDELYYSLYSEILLAKDLIQFGRILFSFEEIKKCAEQLANPTNNQI